MIRLRRVTTADIPLLKYWDTQPHIIEAVGHDDGDGGWDWDGEIAIAVSWRDHLIAEEDGRAIGFIQIIDPAEDETHYWGDVEPDLRAIDIWIGEARDLGRGLGTQIMQLVLEQCFSNPRVKAILIDPRASNRRAHRFYERNGFRFVEHRRFGPDECHVMRLTREGWQGKV